MRRTPVLDKPFLEDMGCIGKNGIRIAIGLLEPGEHVVTGTLVDQRRVVCKGRGTACDGRQRLVIHLNQHHGIFGLIPRIGNNKSDHLTDMADFFARKEPGGNVRSEISSRELKRQAALNNVGQEIGQRVDRPDARRQHRSGRIDRFY